MSSVTSVPARNGSPHNVSKSRPHERVVSDVNAMVRPRPACCTASRMASSPNPCARTVAPGLARSTRLKPYKDGNLALQIRRVSSDEPPNATKGWPHALGNTCNRNERASLSYAPSIASGMIRSSTVWWYPPRPNAELPPIMTNPPPCCSTSAAMFDNCSSPNDSRRMSLWMTTSYSSNPSSVRGNPSVGCSTGHARSPVNGSESTVFRSWPLLPN